MGTANITFGFVGSAVGQHEAPFLEPLESEALTTGLTSAATTAAAPAGSATGNRNFAARVFLSEIGWVWKGAAPTATKTTTGIKVAANTEFILILAPGDKVAVLDDA
jgi:hypothetical protein